MNRAFDLWAFTMLLLGSGSSVLAATGADPSALTVNSELRIAVEAGRMLELQVLPGPEDNAGTLRARFTVGGTVRALDATVVREGEWVRLPFSVLSDAYRSLVLRTMFPADTFEDGQWVHRAREGQLATYDEGLWQVAEWFSTGGSQFESLMRANKLASPELSDGQVVRVPLGLLHPSLHPRKSSADGALEYGEDERGPYATYRLRRGEALYSSVVLRFTGRTDAADVSSVAAELMTQSGLRDPRDIPVGYEVRIPFELLTPEYLPAGHPRRVEAEARREELAEELAREPIKPARAGLEGVLVILDPGHGGRDLGTANHGIWEHDYVYDVACRLRQKLEERTAARVSMTLEDEETGCKPSRGDKLVANQQGTIRTTPGFLARETGEADVGVNLRWYLANSLHRRAVADGIDEDRVVFLSLHADSRHPSLRGAMVYVPGASYRTKTYGSTAGPYSRYREVQEKPHVRFSNKERVRSEALSRKLADALVRGFQEEDLPVQAYQPVRDKVIRGKSVWVPAVLRGNAVPTKVLVEMVNLSNEADAALLGTAKARERLAEALLEGLHGYFGEDSGRIAGRTGSR